MDLGRGEALRNPAWLERTAAALRRPLARLPLRARLKRAYEAVLDRLPGDHLVSRFPDGESVRVSAAHRQITWNLDEYRAFKADIAPGDVVFDIGANVGAYAILFARWTRPSGRVYAFEPAPESRRGLMRHVRLNDCEECVTICSAAVNASGGAVRFRATGSYGDNRIVQSSSPEDGAILLTATSVDQFCDRHRLTPAFIKVDVEGAELEVLRGARRTIARAGDGLRLYVEMHPSQWAASGTSIEAMEQELAVQGLVAERLDGRADTWALEGVCLRLRRCGS